MEPRFNNIITETGFHCSMSKSRNFMGTYNNPKHTLDEFLVVLKALPAKAGRAQLEKGETGTPHIQWCVSLENPRSLLSIAKALKGSHVEVSKNALASWRYCGKDDTRLEGPVEFGLPPAAKNVKGATKERNKMIIEMGVVKACEEGFIPLEKFKQVKQSLDLFNVMKKD